MSSLVKLSPSAFHSISLHYSIDITKEIRGILLGSINNGDVFVISSIPLCSDMNSSEVSVEAKCKELSRIIGMPLQVVGWYHSHNELGLQLTEEDIEFHVGFQAKFPNSVAFLVLFGKNTADSKAKTTSFSAFRCGLDDQPVQLQCTVKPLLPNALAEKFYTVSSISFDEVLQIVREKLSSLKPGEVRELDFGFLQPYLNSVELMIKSTKYLGPKSGTEY